MESLFQQVISPDIERKMKGMEGFRNTAVHQYQRLNIAILEAVITADLNDLIRFGDAALEYLG